MTIHYHPPWYPNQDPSHNPWSIPDQMTGKSHYEAWSEKLKPGELVALIAKHRRKQVDNPSNDTTPTRGKGIPGSDTRS